VVENVPLARSPSDKSEVLHCNAVHVPIFYLKK
jgi:hypothetical protein